MAIKVHGLFSGHCWVRRLIPSRFFLLDVYHVFQLYDVLLLWGARSTSSLLMTSKRQWVMETRATSKAQRSDDVTTGCICEGACQVVHVHINKKYLWWRGYFTFISTWTKVMLNFPCRGPTLESGQCLWCDHRQIPHFKELELDVRKRSEEGVVGQVKRFKPLRKLTPGNLFAWREKMTSR